MEITQRVVGDVTILALLGKLSEESDIARLEDLVSRLIQDQQLKVVLDMANCPYVNQSGLGAMVRALTKLKSNGGNLKLLLITRRFSELLSITKLLTVFEIFDDEAAALASWH